MFRFVARHGLVRMIGGRAVPVMLIWDVVVLADRARRIPVVDQGLRRGLGYAIRGFEAAAASRPHARRPGVPRPGRARSRD